MCVRVFFLVVVVVCVCVWKGASGGQRSRSYLGELDVGASERLDLTDADATAADDAAYVRVLHVQNHLCVAVLPRRVLRRDPLWAAASPRPRNGGLRRGELAGRRLIKRAACCLSVRRIDAELLELGGDRAGRAVYRGRRLDPLGAFI